MIDNNNININNNKNDFFILGKMLRAIQEFAHFMYIKNACNELVAIIYLINECGFLN